MTEDLPVLPDIPCPFPSTFGAHPHPHAETAENDVLALLDGIDAPARLRRRLADIGLGPLTGRLYPGTSRHGLRLAMLYYAQFCLHEDWITRQDPAALTRVYDRVLAAFDGEPVTPDDLPLTRLTARLARHLRAFRLPEHTGRFRTALSDYLGAHLWEADLQRHRRSPTLAEYRHLRPVVLGVRPLHELYPLIHERPVPAHLLGHPVVEALGAMMVNFHVLANDVHSLAKELRGERHPLNTVLVLRAEKGLTLQQGVDATARAAAKELAAYQQLKATLPRLGLDHPALAAHLADVERLAADTVAWHLATPRYQAASRHQAAPDGGTGS
ncbi:terpene synthase family protein [Kitasatospora sp. NPDC096140]|uniref:terpene synthase family protein n=1 Tax=Kitasatospora sp. NPDC096140 TaxID=3155425 RepID=UPI0033316615